MKTIIRPIIIILTLCCLCCLAGCDKGKESQPKQQPKSGPQPQTSEPLPGNYLFEFFNSVDINEFVENFYDDTPIAMVYFKANYTEATIDDPKIIKRIFEALKKVKVGNSLNYSVTDSEIYYNFIMADGRNFGVCFETQGMVRYGTKNYGVIDDGGVFDIEIVPSN